MRITAKQYRENAVAAWCFFDVPEVPDPHKPEEYKRHVLATVKKYNGRYVVSGGKCEGIEGSWRPVYPVIIHFPSLEQARKGYDSREYKDLKALRLSGSDCHAVFMESEPGEFISES